MAATSELLQLASRREKDNENVFDKSSGEDTDNEGEHDELLQNIKSLGKGKKRKRYKGPLRSEPDQQISEFNLKSGDDGKISLDDLVGSLQNTSYHGNLKKTLESMQKMSKTVEAPLGKPTAERIQRVVAYEETSKDISKWEPTVQKNRQAEHLSFPLEPNTQPAMSTGVLTSRFKPQTPLEIEIANVLQNNSRVLERSNRELSLEEEEALKTMSLEEAIERRNELRKLRVLQSHYEQKCRRMKKIKSKKYHRIKRRAEKRAASKETFEQLQEENPELAKIELEKAEKLRIGERMSLKHRNTSKWAKNIITKGIKDTQAREALAEQLRISRQLTETKKDHSESEDDESSERPVVENVENIKNFGLLGDNNDNPWLLNDGKNRKQNVSNDEDKDKADEHVKKLQSITAEETGENNDIEDEASSDGEDDETFELLDKSEIKKKKRKSTRERKKVGKQKNDQGNPGEIKTNKNENVHADRMNNSGGDDEDCEMIDKNETQEKKSKTVKRKRDKGKIEKRKRIEGEVKQKGNKKIKSAKRIISDKNEKKKKKSKIENLEDNNGSIREENTGHERLLMETDGTEVVDDELKRTSEDELGDEEQDRTTVDNTNDNLKLSKVFQIEDKGDLIDYTFDNSDDDDDESKIKRMTIQEAFANDDVIEEFIKEKAEVTEMSKPKDLDTSLPGWGEWGGPGVVETTRKKKLIIKAKPTVAARKDAKLSHVIINEQREKKIAKNQVSSLPYPYTSHEQWERSIRTPLGKHWNTASVHKKLVQPRITTLPGTIIEPIKPTKDIKRTVNEGTTDKRKKNSSSGTRRTSHSDLKIHA